MKYIIVILVCSNADPTNCTVYQRMLAPMTQDACTDLVKTVNYEVPNRRQGTHVRPVCEEAK